MISVCWDVVVQAAVDQAGGTALLPLRWSFAALDHRACTFFHMLFEQLADLVCTRRRLGPASIPLGQSGLALVGVAFLRRIVWHSLRVH